VGRSVIWCELVSFVSDLARLNEAVIETHTANLDDKKHITSFTKLLNEPVQNEKGQ
jgi:hypothetical protein